MSAAYDIATKLEALGLGTLATDLGVNAFVNKGDNEIGVFEYPGDADTRTHADVAFENPDIQVHVRNVSSQTAQSKCYQIYQALGNLKDQTLNSHTYTYIYATVFPILIEREDEKNRTIYMCQFRVQRRPE